MPVCQFLCEAKKKTSVQMSEKINIFTFARVGLYFIFIFFN